MHTLRPNFQDGFLMPYHALLQRIGEGAPLHLPDYVAFAPEEHRGEFSYATEHVTGDAALGALEEMRRCLVRCAEVVPGPWERVQSWINDRIIEVRRQRGVCPGLGAALTAFGMPLGEIVAAALTSDIGDEEDPWQRVEKCFTDSKTLPAPLRSQITVSLQSKWKHLSKARRVFLRLVSRLALTADQAVMIWQADERGQTGRLPMRSQFSQTVFQQRQQVLHLRWLHALVVPGIQFQPCATLASHDFQCQHL